ncbi:MAG: hypothetical protein LC749_11570 [Actinobacteria bacterium]|nr:hypothetical protein [Actinomycetota bacterium]
MGGAEASRSYRRYGVLHRASHAAAALPRVPQAGRAGLGVVGESAFVPNLHAAVVTLTARNRI